MVNLPMPDAVSQESHKAWDEFVGVVQPAAWVRDMVDFYNQTGELRAEDLYRLLGDPIERVDVGSQVCLASHFALRNAPRS